MFAITRANLLRLRGERRLPFFVLALPVLIMVVVGGIFGTGNKRLAVGVVVPTHDAAAHQLLVTIRSSSRLRARDVGGAQAVRSAVRRGRLSAGVIVPSGYSARLARGEAPAITFLAQPGRPDSIEARFDLGAIVARADVDVAVARSIQASQSMPFDAALTQAARRTAGLGDRVPKSDEPPSAFSYTAPSNVVLFAFITALVTSAAVVVSRQLGVTRRVLASPTPALAVIGGELVGSFAVALFQATFLLLVGALFFGVSWGSPVAVALVVVGVAAASAGAGMLLATVARTPDQVIAVGPPIGIALGMLGGCMWSLEGLAPFMRGVGHAVPHAWAMDAFVRLVFDRAPLRAVVGQLAALYAFAVMLVGVAVLRLRRSVQAA